MPTKVEPNILSWAVEPEDKALEQAARTARLPFLAGHLALMPDAHWGMGATIGSVIPTQGAIVPSAVGVDIGCGMIAGRLNLTANALPDDLSAVHSAIAAVVPAGTGQGHATQRSHAIFASAPEALTDKMWSKATKQLGSLGSGNHFVELCLDENDDVWLLLHSGSRGVGKMIADIYIAEAKGLMKRYFVELEDPDLAYLVEGTDSFAAYIQAMTWAQEYAAENRAIMLHACLSAIRDELHGHVSIVDQVNCHHNFTQRENHHGKNIWITRKGAIRARVGDRGLIPGSMGTASYVVRGLGSTASYHSCSHGAGRRLGRKAAERELTFDTLEALMEGKAWNRDRKLLDEHPHAYKDIDAVMAAQTDLVEVEHTLRQVLNYKGL